MRHFFDRTLISLAFAIFSMFFGAGNAIFPLIVGMEAQDKFGWAFLGLLLTAIGGPLLGLFGATLFHGKFLNFFDWTGNILSTILIAVTLALLGPFAVLPRCVTVAYAATASFFPSIHPSLFSVIFCLTALLFCWKQRFILPILGFILSPVLIGCLLLIVYQGFTSNLSLVESKLTNWNAVIFGISIGYDTMDLIASIYFSSGIWAITALRLKGSAKDSTAEIFKTTLQAGTLGCLLLAIIYFGLAHAAAHFSPFLTNISPEKLMAHLANITLGPTLGAIANLAVVLACITTVVSLSMTISNILCKEIFYKKLSYHNTLYFILFITAVMANLGFETIMNLIHPIVSVCYPFIIIVTFVNIYRKLADT